ncbi:hypothetical protein NSE_0187 [Neorickettsia sennetsu str. Miyayama]|uniref:Uncharacterized protein n=1 Tax=Ehrlichia sennetsu (strain ATCC VR-367 / Miyayama) TaxID=222891 RepID=Q2GEL4_EHRS3|nr:hypothetical protein NSE_0187 [Neorickettsia sennetsu str. Miyayama]
MSRLLLSENWFDGSWATTMDIRSDKVAQAVLSWRDASYVVIPDTQPVLCHFMLIFEDK